MAEKNIYQKLMCIQQELQVPKDLTNSFGGYKYRSAEQILEKVKPLLVKYNCTLVMSDEVIDDMAKDFVKACARFIDCDTAVEVKTYGYAKHAKEKKKMDDAQITGAASSYARKYALAGLFLLDDNKDPDALNTTPEYSEPLPYEEASIKKAEEEWKIVCDSAIALSKQLQEQGMEDKDIKAIINSITNGKRLKDSPIEELNRVIEALSKEVK